MTPKLTPAQQRVYDQLGESEVNSLVTEWRGGAVIDASLFRSGYGVFRVPAENAVALLGLLSPLSDEEDEFGLRCYIHPDHATEGRNDD